MGGCLSCRSYATLDLVDRVVDVMASRIRLHDEAILQLKLRLDQLESRVDATKNAVNRM